MAEDLACRAGMAAKRGNTGLFGDQEIFFGLTASLLAAAISTSGIAVMTVFGGWAKRNSAYFSAFAVGLLTVAVMFHLIPEAMSLSDMALGWVAAGFAIMVVIGMIVQVAFRRRPDGAALTFGYASIIALSAHSLLDGVIYSASFQEDPFTGWLATGGLLFHEFPEGVIAYLLLIEAGLGRFRSMVLAFFAAAVTTVVGTLGAFFALGLMGGLPLPAMLGIAAGALIYVLIVHLGPHAARTPNDRGYEIAALGVVIGTLAIILQQLSGI